LFLRHCRTIARKQLFFCERVVAPWNCLSVTMRVWVLLLHSNVILKDRVAGQQVACSPQQVARPRNNFVDGNKQHVARKFATCCRATCCRATCCAGVNAALQLHLLLYVPCLHFIVIFFNCEFINKYRPTRSVFMTFARTSISILFVLVCSV